MEKSIILTNLKTIFRKDINRVVIIFKLSKRDQIKANTRDILNIINKKRLLLLK